MVETAATQQYNFSSTTISGQDYQTIKIEGDDDRKRSSFWIQRRTSQIETLNGSSNLSQSEGKKRRKKAQ